MPRVNILPAFPGSSGVKPKTRISPMGTQARDAQRDAMIKAQDALVAERQTYMNSHGGNYPSDTELDAFRKGKKNNR
jgi:hypothetical protein